MGCSHMSEYDGDWDDEGDALRDNFDDDEGRLGVDVEWSDDFD